jgi:hypothetical protein
MSEEQLNLNVDSQVVAEEQYPTFERAWLEESDDCTERTTLAHPSNWAEWPGYFASKMAEFWSSRFRVGKGVEEYFNVHVEPQQLDNRAVQLVSSFVDDLLNGMEDLDPEYIVNF